MSTLHFVRVYPSCERERRMLALFSLIQKDVSSLHPILTLARLVEVLVKDPVVFKELVIISKHPLLFLSDLCISGQKMKTGRSTPPGEIIQRPVAEAQPPRQLRRSPRAAKASRKLADSKASPTKPLKEWTQSSTKRSGASRKRTRSAAEDDDEEGESEKKPRVEDVDSTRPTKKARKTRPVSRKRKN